MTRQPGDNSRPDLPLAVVVGAGGLGMVVARRLGQNHRLLIADRDQEHLARQIAALRETGHDARGLACDVTKPQDIEALVREAQAAGQVKSLAYVVGVSPSLGGFETIMAVNLVGAANTLRAFEPVLASGGAALCIGSSAAHMQNSPPEVLALVDNPLSSTLLADLSTLLGENASPALAYVHSKKGLMRLCRRLAAEWGRRGLRIVSLSPGLIATPQGATEYQSSPGKRRLFDTSPFGREATMLEIAEVASFLLSDGASFISGTDILVDGGLIASTVGQ